MLNGGTSESIDAKAALAIQTLIELFSQSHKHILYQGDAVSSHQDTPTPSQQRPTLTILSGIPG
jgi:hypothetical protein